MGLTGRRFILLFICLLLARRSPATRLHTRHYVGCFADTSARDLPGLTGVSVLKGYSVHSVAFCVIHNSMTLELCASVCTLGGFAYMGVQVGVECYCGPSYGRHGPAAAGACYHGCSGSSSQQCGGPNANSVYELRYSASDVFKISSRAGISMLSSYSAYTSISANSDLQCLAMCGPGCQAAIFNHQQRLCSLLKFALVPTQLSAVTGDFFTRL